LTVQHTEAPRSAIRVAGLRQRRRLFSGRALFLLSVLVPTAAAYLIFAYLPVIASIAMSFSSVGTFLNLQNAKFVGLANYQQAFGDPLTWRSLANTSMFALLTVPLGTALALGLAILLNSIRRGRSLLRMLYFIPVITSMVAVSVRWRWLYQPRFGLFNVLLEAVTVPLGLRLPMPRWLGDPRLALMSIAIMCIWKGLGFNMVIFLAGLTGLPLELYEVARIDGAGRWQLFRKITLPLLQPTMSFVLITGVINALQVFTPVYVMTQDLWAPAGGPMDSTYTFVLLIYNRAFKEFRGGYTSALAVILFTIILAVSISQFRLYRTAWEY